MSQSHVSFRAYGCSTWPLRMPFFTSTSLHHVQRTPSARNKPCVTFHNKSVHLGRGFLTSILKCPLQMRLWGMLPLCKYHHPLVDTVLLA
eukprot:4734635-Amphidinium_carterae.1